MTIREERLAPPAQSPLEQIGSGLIEVLEGLRRALRDTVILSVFLSFLLVLMGFGGFYLTWWGMSGTLAVGAQLAYLISGGVGGFALIGAGMGIAYVQMSRHIAAREDREWATALDRALGILEQIRTKGRFGRLRTAPQHDLAR